MPKTFQRALLVPLEPPFAEHHLSKEHHEANQQAHEVSAIRSKIQSKREIDDGSDDGLRYIVGQTHTTIETEVANPLLEALVLIKQDKR